MDHKPVLLQEVCHYVAMAPETGPLVDATFGRGGYARAFLESNTELSLVAMDRDPTAAQEAQGFQTQYPGRFLFKRGRFSLLADHLEAYHGICRGVVFDFGVSSPQLDEAQRGFSFQHDGPLDMRMSMAGDTAAAWLADVDESTLAQVIKTYGGEKRARSIARAIVRARKNGPITTTHQLRDLVSMCFPPQERYGRIHPATRTFQALRIMINDELKEIEQGLEAALTLLRPGGFLVAVSFHSLEDRLVKAFINKGTDHALAVSRFEPPPKVEKPKMQPVTKKPITPGEKEVTQNPRSRSAKLRVGMKCATS